MFAHFVTRRFMSLMDGAVGTQLFPGTPLLMPFLLDIHEISQVSQHTIFRQFLFIERQISV